jgi:pseudaminic acid synthase
MNSVVEIAGRPIGGDYPPYIVAELSANHGGSLSRALATIDAAKQCGADAVKLQTYTADTITLDHDSADFQIEGGPWSGRSLYDLYNEAHTPWEWHAELFARGRARDLPVFSSPFDETAVDLLLSLDAPAYKVASFELVHLPLIDYVARTGKPVIMSTGMASVAEIEEAVSVFKSAGGQELILLHCISGYPTPIDQSNLRRIPALSDRFGVPVGLSDHSIGVEVAIAAVALGACFIEKHFTIDGTDGGPDAAFSIEPAGLQQLVSGTRAAHMALGSSAEARTSIELANRIFRRSIYVVSDIMAGEKITRENVRVIRPGFGLEPRHYSSVLGRSARVALKRGTPLVLSALE